MGALPKHKGPKARRMKRRRAFELRHRENIVPMVCSNCKKNKLPHRACTNCGMYRGIRVLEPKTSVKRVSK